MMFWFSDTDPSKVCMDLSKHQRFENHTSYLWRTRGGCPVRTGSKDKENDVAHLSIEDPLDTRQALLLVHAVWQATRVGTVKSFGTEKMMWTTGRGDA